jgi:hypothetical protein
MNRLTYEERKKANKIRSKLLYTIDRDIRDTKKKSKNKILINSMTSQEIEDKYLLFQNYKMKISTTFTKTANKYMVMQTVDKNLNTNFFYTDYLQDNRKESHRKVKLERKKISANNIIKIPLLVDTQEMTSPMPEIFTNKVNIGFKKLIKSNEIDSKNLININNIKTITNNSNIELNENEDKKMTINDKNKSKKMNKNDDDSSIYSVTIELLQKKANILTNSINNKNKKEMKRRKKQIEAIRNLRQFCFQKLRNKRRCITKSSHQNLIYLNNKLDEEDEKNNSNFSTKNNTKNNKNKNAKSHTRNNMNKQSKNNSKKKTESMNESNKKKTPKKIKDSKRIDSTLTKRKFFKHNSSKKSPLKIKRAQTKRKSLVIQNIISGKLDKDILRFKGKKERLPLKNSYTLNKELYDNDNIIKCRKKRTGILRDLFKEKPKFFNSNNNKNNFLLNSQKQKNYNVNFNEQIHATKRNSSSNNFFNRKYKSKIHCTTIQSSRSLIKPIKKFKIRKTPGSRSDRKRRYSSPEKLEQIDEKDKKESKSEKSYKIKDTKADIKKNYNPNYKLYIYTDKNNFNKLKKRRNSYIGKIKINKGMYKVVEEDD